MRVASNPFGPSLPSSVGPHSDRPTDCVSPSYNLANVVTGLVSGVLSGLIVSAVALLTSYLAKPRFELRYASSDAVTLRHNRLWPTVIGGTWEFGAPVKFLRQLD